MMSWPCMTPIYQNQSWPAPLALEQFPVPLGDDLGGAVDHSDGALIVDRVGRHRNSCRPLLCIGKRSVGVVRVLQVRDHREVNETCSVSRDQGSVNVTLGRGEDDVLRLHRPLSPAWRFAVGLDEGGGSSN